MTIFKTSFAALALVVTGVTDASSFDKAPELAFEKGIGKVAVNGVELSFVMGKAYDPNDEYDDDEPSFTSVRNISVYDDRGTFLAAVETLEKRCRSEPYPMNVDLDKFKKLRADWLKNPATASNYKKASKEFHSIRIRAVDEQTADDYDWQSVCSEINPYVMELKIFKHMPDSEWSKYEAKAPVWMKGDVSGSYPYVDQVKFTAYKVAHVDRVCSSAPRLNEDNWRLTRASRVEFTAGNANEKQTKDFEHYAALVDQAIQRIEWNLAREDDIPRLARVCSEFQALVSTVNDSAAPAENLPMDRIAGVYLVGIALRDVQCSAGASVVRNAVEFARQNGKTEGDVRAFAVSHRAGQLKALTTSVDASRNTGAMDSTLELMCQLAISSTRFLGLPNPK
ncbi:hypothetical protein [Agrobacterium tumefaciens]|uniref:hypothetical protein n=1 Tax=Agrobacterium tumefaciens TaxID=358 RepID=UPI001572C247|nr:hypothetical protein [Agrobacterium tumefaciens]NTE37647.1 hypothetical protein [Agrobacterium tumefaciens]NTE53159.1 hypothetical protein [Agrobacterium tumefaciens]